LCLSYWWIGCVFVSPCNLRFPFLCFWGLLPVALCAGFVFSL
jgi:hypothetical protein